MCGAIVQPASGSGVSDFRWPWHTYSAEGRLDFNNAIWVYGGYVANEGRKEGRKEGEAVGLRERERETERVCSGPTVKRAGFRPEEANQPRTTDW